MKYKLVKKANPANRDAPEKWYANAVNMGKHNIKNLAEQIAARTSLSRGDIENVLTTMVEVLPIMLKLGLSVQLGNFGTLRLTLSSEGVDNPKEFKTTNIKAVKVIFTPSTEMKKSLENTPFELMEISE